ncbi:MAG: sigma-70 family RNA polymerase sigma factor [Chloroflexi bacterium]|nr:sigma-70 family RNA polymerase sigma factor [Chloroflexota bacterium]
MGDPSHDSCRRIVHAELARRGWQLADPEALADEVCREMVEKQVPAADLETKAKRATLRHYCVILHTACSAHGTDRQRRGFEELWYYLYPIAHYKLRGDPSFAEDLTQQALEKTWKNLANCRDAGSFLNYATLILINEIRQYFRDKFKNGGGSDEPAWFEKELDETDLSDTNSEGDVKPFDVIEDESSGEALDKVIVDEDLKELLAVLEECVENRLYREVLIDLFFEDKGFAEIASSRRMTVAHVYVCKNRGLKELSQCEAFIRFVERKRR